MPASLTPLIAVADVRVGPGLPSLTWIFATAVGGHRWGPPSAPFVVVVNVWVRLGRCAVSPRSFLFLLVGFRQSCTCVLGCPGLACGTCLGRAMWAHGPTQIFALASAGLWGCAAGWTCGEGPGRSAQVRSLARISA